MYHELNSCWFDCSLLAGVLAVITSAVAITKLCDNERLRRQSSQGKGGSMCQVFLQFCLFVKIEDNLNVSYFSIPDFVATINIFVSHIHVYLDPQVLTSKEITEAIECYLYYEWMQIFMMLFDGYVNITMC